MTVAQMKVEMARLGLSQTDVAEMLGITQPTVSNILSNEHELTERNAEAFMRGLARHEAETRVSAYVDFSNGSVKCNDGKRRLTVTEFLRHLDMCPSCMARAFLTEAE
jgi:predicted transcriptional regulator